MTKCWNCSAEVPSGARFCPNCGKDQTQDPKMTNMGGQTNPATYPQSRPTSYGEQIDPAQLGQLERRVDTVYKILIGILVLQVLFIILVI